MTAGKMLEIINGVKALYEFELLTFDYAQSEKQIVVRFWGPYDLLAALTFEQVEFSEFVWLHSKI